MFALALPAAAGFCLLAGCGTSVSATPAMPSLYINEVMAQNDTTISDFAGNNGYPDWIEIYNAGTVSVDLGGMYLTDDLLNPTMWRIPDGVVIPAGGYLLFWADNDPEQGSTHTNFKLDTAGESVGLFDTAAKGYAAIDVMTFGQLGPDVSYGRHPDGSSTWRTFTAATPGQSNQ